MSNLSFNISSSKSVIVQSEETVTVPKGAVNIRRIVDYPGDKKVVAFVDGVGRLELSALSDANYDSPAEWTNADVVTAVKDIING
tara:strand:+ start:183 stop:437 length:255 start_codon:yes stop_codon:yes gene_type:complete